MHTNHIPVLTDRVLEFLEPKPGKVYIDATLGLGGHTEAIMKASGGEATVYGIDVDERNLEKARERLTPYKNVHYSRDNFENLERIGQEIHSGKWDRARRGHEDEVRTGLVGSRSSESERKKGVDGILLDLGLSSVHVDEADRGFSFQQEGPLDMRFDTRSPLTAADIINTYSLEDLTHIFRTYGEERNAYRFAKDIVAARRTRSFTTTAQLADFVANAVIPPDHSKHRAHKPKKFYFKRHPATRIFQALRIATNRELEVLENGLAGGIKTLSSGGRLVVISYHSLEDRIVKNFFRNQAKNGTLKILTKKPISPSGEQREANRRARSAKLRAAEKI